MDKDFHHRQREIRTEQERANNKGHSTLETWKIEQQDAQEHGAQPDLTEPKKPGLMQRIRKLFGGK